MATPPTFTTGAVLTAAQMNSVGLWLVKSQTVGTGVSSVTVTGAFSGDYDNYRIIYTGGTTSSGLQYNMQLGATTTGYYNILLYGSSYATPTPTGTGTNNGAAWSFLGWGETSGGTIECDIFAPFLSTWTRFRSAFMAASNAGQNSGTQQSATSFTSFTVSVPGGTMTGGTIRVYGYRN